MATGGPIFLPLSHRDRDHVGRRVSVPELTPVVLSVTVGEPCSMATDRDLVQANSPHHDRYAAGGPGAR